MNNHSPGADKVELWPGCRFYVNAMDYGFVKKTATFKGQISWGIYSCHKYVSGDIYGRNIVYYSAAGHRLSKSPGIDKRLYRGLWCWVENVTMKNNPIDMSAFNAHINHLISNKRRYMPKFRSVNKNSQIGTSTERKKLEDCSTDQRNEQSQYLDNHMQDEYHITNL